MVLRPGELQLTRGESVRDTALVLSRHVAAIGAADGLRGDARGARRARRGARRQHALARAPPVPGARGPADDARGVRRRSRGAGSPTSATATTSRARSRVVGGLAGVEVTVAAPAGLPARGRRGRTPERRPGRGRGGRGRALHRRLGLDGRRRGDRRSARRAALARLPASTTRCSTAPRRARSPCTACPRTRARRSPPRCSTATRQRIWDQAENRRHAQKALLELPRRRRLAASDGAVTHPRGRRRHQPRCTRACRRWSTGRSSAASRDDARRRDCAPSCLDELIAPVAARPCAGAASSGHRAPDHRLRRPDRRRGRARARRHARRRPAHACAAYERANANRKTVLAAIERKLA